VNSERVLIDRTIREFLYNNIIYKKIISTSDNKGNTELSFGSTRVGRKRENKNGRRFSCDKNGICI